jgi:hypothetical protein
MAICPVAIWRPISGSSGPHLGGPCKIVHHTTEGSTAQGARNAFSQNKDPRALANLARLCRRIETTQGVVQWGAQAVNFWTAAQRMTLNTEFYARRRADVLARLEADNTPQYIADLRLGSR